MSQGNTTPQPAASSSSGPAAAGAPGAQQDAPLTIQEDSPFLPRASSTYAEGYDAAWTFNLWVSIIFFVIVIAPMGWFAFRYKRKSEDEKTSPIDHHLQLEIFWTAVPTILLIYMFWVGFKIFANSQIAPDDAMEIKVTGSMYTWKFQYPDGTVCNELGVPKGRPVKLLMSSTDTIHAFYVPEFRLKADVVPNLYTTMWFQATNEMETAAECAEYCGIGHSGMLTRVSVLPSGDANTPGTYEAWLNNGCEKKPLPPLQAGQKKYQQICKSCHSLDGSRLIGPSFKGLWGKQEKLADGRTVLVDENYVRKSLVTPSADIVAGDPPYPDQMPNLSYLKDRDIEGIIAFLKEQK